MTVRRISKSDIKRSATAGGPKEAPPVGISPILRSSWLFARNAAGKFNKEMLNDRLSALLRTLAKKFS